MRGSLLWTLILVGCGGSPFEEAGPAGTGGSTADAAAGGTGGTQTGGTGGTQTGGTGGTQTGGTGGTPSGGTGGTQTGGAGGTQSGGAGGTPSGGEGGACDCVPLVPDWEGPVVIREGETAPACDADYVAGVLLYDGLEDGDACKCDCQPFAKLQLFATANCSDAPCVEKVIHPGQCETWPSAEGCGSGLKTSGHCGADPVLPLLSWKTKTQVCEPPNSDTCPADYVCLPPRSSDALVCVRTQQDLECPTGYSEKRLRYGDHAGDRTCSGCACSSSGITGSLQRYNSGICSGTLLSIPVPTSSCVNLATTANQVSATFLLDQDLTCSPTTSAVSGDVAPTNPVTFCCKQQE